MARRPIRQLLVDFGAWLDVDYKAKQILFLLQVIAGGSAALYKIYPQYETAFAVAFCISTGLVVLWSLVVVFWGRRYGLNCLVYNRKTGVLYDKSMSIPNVALRRRTVQAILDAVVEGDEGGRAAILRSLGVSSPLKKPPLRVVAY